MNTYEHNPDYIKNTFCYKNKQHGNSIHSPHRETENNKNRIKLRILHINLVNFCTKYMNTTQCGH